MRGSALTDLKLYFSRFPLKFWWQTWERWCRSW